MTFIFSTKVWNKYYASPESKRDYNFNNLFGIYPHVCILANYFSDSKIFYYDQPLVIVGEGLIDWSNETNNNYWMSDLVLIHKKV